jgi:hypothetical protein
MQVNLFLLAFLLLGSCGAHAEQKTVCTITVNSADEKEAFRRHLPQGQYRFVELVEQGRADWLAASCERAIECDVLVVSGHFNAGDTFYSDRVEARESLSIDELERASCSASCPALFSRLKEVYLFGCESLNPDASKYSSHHGDSGLERMRRIFAKVPLIYGFSSAAPVGAVAATRLDRYFAGGASEIGSGQRSSRLLAAFAPSGMTATRGMPESQASRRQVCEFFDERLGAAHKLSLIHETLRGDMRQAMALVGRIATLLDSLTADERSSGAFLYALAGISADDATRARFLVAERASVEPAARSRMIALATTLGWLSPEERVAEIMGTINDFLGSRAFGFGEVEAICTLNETRELDGELARVKVPPARAGSAAVAAALACLGDGAARARVLAALSSGDERDVQVAQVYLRHRPAHEPHELLTLARDIGRMTGSGGQVRALDTLGRLRIANREIVDELTGMFAAAKSLDIQKAIAEIFLRSDIETVGRSELARKLRRDRLVSVGGEDLIDILIRRLLATSTSSAS